MVSCSVALILLPLCALLVAAACARSTAVQSVPVTYSSLQLILLHNDFTFVRLFFVGKTGTRSALNLYLRLYSVQTWL